MKILFINPLFMEDFSRPQRSPAVTKGGTFYYPFWLSAAAGVCEKAGNEILLIDAIADNRKEKELLEEIKNFNPDIAVINTSTPSIYNDIEEGIKIKEQCSDCFIVLVGTHPSALPEETLQLNLNIDAVCIGEYDYTLKELAELLQDKKSLNNLKGICFRDNGNIINNGRRELIENLDELPFVSKTYKKFLNIKNYYFAAADYPMVMIITGRGCPFKCFFCVYPQTFHSRRYRLRSAENVVEEFNYIKKHMPEVKEIGIEDDTFTANRIRTKKICNLLIEQKNKMKWWANVRADLDLETMKLMKKAGCRLVIVGFESGSNKILKNMHKGISKEMSIKFMKNCKKAGLLVHGCMMVGNPQETKQTMIESLNFALQLDCDSFQFYPLYVYPGTEAYNWAKENNYLSTNNFRKWLTPEGQHNCILNLPDLSSKEMVDFCNQAYKKYHFNIKYISKKLLQLIVNPPEGFRTARSAIKYFKSFFRK